MFEKLKKDINSELKAFVEEKLAEFGVKRASRLLYDGLHDFLLRSGKRIRPILFILSYGGYAKKKFSYKGLLRAALSLELLHDFFLIHDDVIDESDLRRNKPTLHRLFNRKLSVQGKNELGSNLSIVAGDITLALAMEALLASGGSRRRKEECFRLFAETAALTGMGEFIDVSNNTKKIEKISKKDILLTYALKTARYSFQAPLVMGAVLAGAKANEQNKLSELGAALGEAFQIRDDLMGIFSSDKKIGKSVLSDLNESKKTLPVWHAHKTLKKNDKRIIAKILEKDKNTHKDLARFRTLIKRAGSDIYCLERIASLAVKAALIIPRLKMRTEHKHALKRFIDNIFR